ncbi:hypothetical protein FFLO_04429 [Filobasidium floriforme]|uniref:Uncharacterized protein n=1 Tax=Filobasidium floriforme TaxID=5210 RepID=A0A8K0JKX2_9TREE|nr:uncharacterized protein HD553DRAFT_322411 [Filobasidium floriforme]KAG7531308.1 hypothetical protein FFLO_04429 [Filobasidium floriforme]KAH8088558.1 hypothetical protein HD553DRAFT_322411 [Filobasidium floriforme]
MSKGERNETKPPRASQNKAPFSVSELSETQGMYAILTFGTTVDTSHRSAYPYQTDNLLQTPDLNPENAGTMHASSFTAVIPLIGAIGASAGRCDKTKSSGGLTSYAAVQLVNPASAAGFKELASLSRIRNAAEIEIADRNVRCHSPGSRRPPAIWSNCHGASFTASLESGSKNNGTCILWVTGKGVDEDRDYLKTTEKEFKTGTILGTCEEHERVVNVDAGGPGCCDIWY